MSFKRKRTSDMKDGGGHVTGTPAFINLNVKRRTDDLLLAHHDFVIFPAHASELTLRTSEKYEKFELNYTFIDVVTQLEEDQITSGEPFLHVTITDCGFSRSFGLQLSSKDNKRGRGKRLQLHSQMADDMSLVRGSTMDNQRWATYAPLFIISSCVGTTYLLVCLVYTLIRHFSFTDSKYTVHARVVSRGEQGDSVTVHKIPLAPQSFRFNRGGEQLYSSRSAADDGLYYGEGQYETNQYNPAVIRLNSTNWHRLQTTESRPWAIYSTRSRSNAIPVRRVLLFAHLAFRVFYTFLFTFSVAVSLIFSLQPATRPNASELVFQRRRMLGPLLRLQAESRWLESFAEQELRRQLDYVDRMKVACQHAVGVEITDAVREMRQLVQDTLDKWHYDAKANDYDEGGKQRQTEELGNGISESHMLINKYFAQQRQSLDKYRVQTEQAFDYRVTNFYRAYAQLLDNTYNSGWLRYVQRMLNTSLKSDSTVLERDSLGMSRDSALFDAYDHTRWRGTLHSHYLMAQQNSGLDTKHVTMMTYMGFQQAEFVHFLPLQLKQELKRVFLSNQYRPQVLPPDLVKATEPVGLTDRQVYSTDVGGAQKPPVGSTVERTFLSTNDMHHVEVSRDSSLLEAEYTSTTESTELTFRRGRWTNETLSPRILGQVHALSLTELRLVLLVVDFFIIICRFYHTFLSLRNLWFGQKIHVDAASLLTVRSGAESATGTLLHASPSLGTNNRRGRLSHTTDNGDGVIRSSKSTGLGRHSSSKLALLQELSKQNNRYECTHVDQEQQADLMADQEVSELDPTSEKTTRDKPSDMSVQAQPLHSNMRSLFAAYQCFPTNPHIVFRTEPLPLEAALALPPPPSLGPEQNVGCLLGIRVTCCRQSHYLCAVVGITVVLALFGLLILQEQRVLVQPTNVDHRVWRERTTNQVSKTVGQTATLRLSLQLSAAQFHYENIIEEQAKRLNGEWLMWTKSKELSMRRRLLSYTSRFKHDFSFFDRQIKAESELIAAATARLTKDATGKPDRSLPRTNSSAELTSTTRLNSELLFRQQICHFLPVVPVRMPNTAQQEIKSPTRFSNEVDYKKMSVQNLLWTALISRAVDFDWSSLEQARQLSVTALLVAIGMLGCVGIVDICGWMVQLRYLNPLYKTARSGEASHTSRSELQSGCSNLIPVDPDHIVLVSPQPPPIIPYPEEEEQNGDQQRLPVRPPASPTAQTHSSLLGLDSPLAGPKRTSLKTSWTQQQQQQHHHNQQQQQQPQLPLTAFYVDPNLVLTSNTIHGLPLAVSSQSVPIYIAHTPGSPIVIAPTSGMSPTQTRTTQST
ncbi:unnamed protein product [Echinostoma caproni]|uniref:PHM7_cyt domain-containing protein n=1 Tax=Echinostoma caproni TaxID=27848 RepID=A0A183A5Z6_9TREM|nr:unnamed protein product [Echinostoma caproni]